DRIVILKSARSMTLLSGGKVLKTYKVALGSVPVGPKRVEGDHQTPEGSYIVDAKNPHSRFHLSLHISYPSAADQQCARSMGARPGGAIMIHGLARPFAYLGPLHRQRDWTDGCISVTNAEIEEIYGSWFPWEQESRFGLSFSRAASKIFLFVKDFSEQHSITDVAEKAPQIFSTRIFAFSKNIFERTFNF
ncbi:MAG TPA: L,D-transpeptidase family protein, partial [Candidatus Angelobacter sp.]|nr:L,D-transpeptidase family protein [Candidatus Angelobacter sp.]